MAGRASVEFYVGLALKSRGKGDVTTEEAFVVRTFRNGLAVYVSKWVQLVFAQLVKLKQRVSCPGWASRGSSRSSERPSSILIRTRSLFHLLLPRRVPPSPSSIRSWSR